MPALQKTITNAAGEPIAGATVAITTAVGGLPNLYELVNGEKGDLIAGNELVTGSAGQIAVWVESGLYNLVVQAAGYLDFQFFGVPVGFGEATPYVALLTNTQSTLAPVGVPVITSDPVAGLTLVDHTGSAMPLDNGAITSAPGLGSQLGPMLSALADGLKDAYGTANQIILTFASDGTSVTFSTPQDIGTTSDVVFASVKAKLKPPLAALTSANFTLGPGAGTGATINSVVGDETFFRVQFTAGTSPSTNANVFTLTYPGGFASKPIVLMAPRNRYAMVNQSALGTALMESDALSTKNQLVILSGLTALTAGTAYEFSFDIRVGP